MLTQIWLFEIGFVIVLDLGEVISTSLFNITTCEAFERGAHFDIYNITSSRWKIIYYWSKNTEINPITFSLVSKQRLDKFKAVVNAVDPQLSPEWHKATLFMEPRRGVEILLLYAGTPGAFRAVVKVNQKCGLCLVPS
ncbi:unnamed protein product [Leptidea sinapis]|uniref:F5/8 type C domain-containing protein n=1 Tax=Leptidea sinapis TaxID=189913 RepID=A0A5E4R452_9NEOP|nr:unnamed protein product [Leptidea sinapis]